MIVESIVLFYIKNGNLTGYLEDAKGNRKRIICKKLSGKAATGADKFTCLLSEENMRWIGTAIIGKMRIGKSEGSIVGKLYLESVAFDIVELRSKKGLNI